MPGFVLPVRSVPGVIPTRHRVLSFMGDSITLGFTPPYPFDGTYTYSTGYRKYVYQNFRQAAYGPIAIGYQQDSLIFNLDADIAGDWNAGILGTTATTWLPVVPYGGGNYFFGLVKPQMDAQTANPTPDIIVFMLGANGGNTSGDATLQLDMVDILTTTYPLCHVVVCSRTPQTAHASDIVNAALLAGVNTRIAGGAKVLWFDMFSTITSAATDIPDGLHPSAAGYQKMGNALSAQLLTWLTNGTIP